MNYNLDNTRGSGKAGLSAALTSAREFSVYIHGDGAKLVWAFVMVAINSIAAVVTPYIVARAIDHYIVKGDVHGLGIILSWLAGLFVLTVVTGY